MPKLPVNCLAFFSQPQEVCTNMQLISTDFFSSRLHSAYLLRSMGDKYSEPKPSMLAESSGSHLK